MKASPLWSLLLLSAAHAAPVIVPHPHREVKDGETVVWTGAMQAAFDRVIGAKAPMKLERVEPPNPLIDRMRAFRWKEDAILPKDGWIAEAGPADQALIDRANERWKKLAGADATPFKAQPIPNGLMALVGIKRDFLFKKEFVASGSGRMNWGKDQVPVKFFGSRRDVSGDYRANVRVLSYRPAEGSYALQFTAREGDDTMVLYLPKEGQSMMEAMQWVKQWRGEWDARKSDGLAWDDPSLHGGDELRVPEIELKAETEMSEAFAGHLMFRGQMQPWRVKQAWANVSLDVDAKGVKFTSQAVMGMDPFAGETPQPVPRKFLFNRPFFLFLWRDKAAWPYAAVWFGDAEAFAK